MKEEQLVVKIKRTRKYNSYQGEISPAVDNLINRNFSASKPNEKWLTDITEFAIPAGKVYLSPIVDCFDGLLVNWNISTSPDALLVNSMLDDAAKSVSYTHLDRSDYSHNPGKESQQHILPDHNVHKWHQIPVPSVHNNDDSYEWTSLFPGSHNPGK